MIINIFFKIIKGLNWRITNEIKSFIQVIRCFIVYLFNIKNTLIICAWIKYGSHLIWNEKHMQHNNWGDDINYHILKKICNKKILVYPNSYLSRFLLKITKISRFFFIGSILTMYPLKNATICGSGVMKDDSKETVMGKPAKILFVRGPLSRGELLLRNVDCPEVYGDPALILPFIYQPVIKKHIKIGLVPHYVDEELQIVKDLLAYYKDDIVLIKMKGYDKWTDIIDTISSCDVILSSSLHGLIVSEAYNIPSVWCKFGSYPSNWDFKYNDFYASIKKQTIPVYISSKKQCDELYSKRSLWKQGSFEAKKLLSVIKQEISGGVINE